MSTFHRLHSLPILLLFLLSASGCEKLQRGYYLTPEHYPTRPAQQQPVEETAPPSPTVTPPSTVNAIPTLTPTLLFTTPPPLTATPTPLPCTETQGTIIHDALMSQITGRPFRYRIYLPPCYAQSGRRYPYLIMLHGLVPGTDIMNDSQWDQLGLDEAADQGYAQGALPPLVIVMPNGNDADYAYDAGPLPEVIVEELIPAVESRYCLWSDAAHRAIGGLSRGGYWAYWIAFSHPDLFTRVGGHSPFFYEATSPAEKNPNNLVDSTPGLEQLTMYLDHGRQDYVDVNVRDFVSRLERRDITPQYVVNAVGSHNEEYWAAHVADYLLFYTADWPRHVEDFPLCDGNGQP